MFGSSGAEVYLFNQFIFIVLIGLFGLAGFRVAGTRIKNKNDNKKKYYSIVLSYPFGFLTSFFLIDSLYNRTDVHAMFSASYSLLVYWTAVVMVGVVISSIVSLFIIKQQRGKSQ